MKVTHEFTETGVKLLVEGCDQELAEFVGAIKAMKNRHARLKEFSDLVAEALGNYQIDRPN